uniref:Uncharacterized protein n=1 Tax=Setaria digitata TaxID=48799 RepID=A0A915Q1B8_9BILA
MPFHLSLLNYNYQQKANFWQFKIKAKKLVLFGCGPEMLERQEGVKCVGTVLFLLVTGSGKKRETMFPEDPGLKIMEKSRESGGQDVLGNRRGVGRRNSEGKSGSDAFYKGRVPSIAQRVGERLDDRERIDVTLTGCCDAVASAAVVVVSSKVGA